MNPTMASPGNRHRLRADHAIGAGSAAAIAVVMVFAPPDDAYA